MMKMFYETMVASALLFADVSWSSRLRVANGKRLNKPIHKANDVVEVDLYSVTVVANRRMLSKLHAILDSVTPCCAGQTKGHA